MNNIWTLIQLQFRAGIKLPHSSGKVKTILKFVFLLSLAVVLLGGLVAVYYLLAKNFIHEKGSIIDLRNEFLTFTLVGFQIIQTLFLIPMLIKTLDISNDRELLLKLPVSSRQIFISKIVVAYMYELVFAAVILLPILLAYGFASSMLVGYFFLIPILLVFVPVVPFFIAIITMFPVIKVVQLLRNRSWLTILLYLAGLVALIVGYMYIVSGAVYAIADKGFADLLQNEANVHGIKHVAGFFYPAKFFANLFDTSPVTAGISIVAIVAVSAVLCVIAFFVAGAKYKRIYMNEHVTVSKDSKKGLFLRRPAGAAVFEKDVKNILFFKLYFPVSACGGNNPFARLFLQSDCRLFGLSCIIPRK